MVFEKEIHHRNDLNLKGYSICRRAVRGIIRKNNKLLLVYSIVNDEYKFPGGGLNDFEKHEEALIREISEETGGIVKEIKSKIGTVIEYNKSKEDTIDFFKMISDYYEVDIEEEIREQKLDPYEKELEFVPRWISIEEALKVNVDNINDGNKKKTKWIERETYVLNELNKYYKYRK